MATSSQTSPAGTVQVYPLWEAPLPETVFVDHDGDVWAPNGHTEDGELLLACPNPSNPEDAGEGPPFPWTLTAVERAFGPLTAQADVQQDAIAAVDQEFLDYYGSDQSRWVSWQVATYEDAMAKAFARFVPQGGVAA